MMKAIMADGELRGQILRYAISGAGLTGFYSVVYWVSAVLLDIAALVANTIAFVLSVAIGFTVHSRWSFRSHGRRDRPMRMRARFLAVNIAGYSLNSLWVWAIVEHAGLAPSWPLIPIVFVTPWLAFWFNRRWTFG